MDFKTEEDYWKWIDEISDRMSKCDSRTFALLTGVGE